MKKEEVKINFYHISKCGYYKRGQENPEFGDIITIFSELKLWAFDNKKPLAETCTYEPDDNSGMLRTYCFDIQTVNNSEDILITTWNETETLDGGMASVNGKEPAGNASVNTTKVPTGHIPGYPTYFWIIPSKRAFATLRFDARSNGHTGLKLLLSDFIAKFTSYVAYSPSNQSDEEELLGYRKNKQDEAQNLYPMFKSYQIKLPSHIEKLKKNRTKITKLKRKTVLTLENQDDRGFLQKILGSFGMTDSPQLAGEMKIKTEIPYTPSTTELDQMISEWEKEVKSNWNNIGFVISGEQNTIWLSHALAKIEMDLDVDRDNTGIIKLSSIESSIAKHRKKILNTLP